MSCAYEVRSKQCLLGQQIRTRQSCLFSAKCLCFCVKTTEAHVMKPGMEKVDGQGELVWT